MSAMIGAIAASNAATSCAAVGHGDRQRADPPDAALRQRQDLHVQLERVCPPAARALVLGDRARVRAVRRSSADRRR
jgi:hypothetical protein